MDERTESSGAPNPQPAAPCDTVRLRLAVAAFVAFWLNTALAYAGLLDFSPSDFNIMDADGTRVIGHAHYEVKADGNGYATVFGEDRFNDGEYDIERSKLELPRGDQFPRMVTFEHTFFNANGTLQRINNADFQTGSSSCTQYENGQPRVESAILEFPPDTFAGAMIVIPLKGYLSRGEGSQIILHDFNCIPGPEILTVKAYPQPPAEWDHFPGEVVRVDIKPDFGWLSFLLALLVPEIHVGFSPSDDWRFVGGKFTGFYRGPEVMLALAPKTEHQETSRVAELGKRPYWASSKSRLCSALRPLTDLN